MNAITCPACADPRFLVEEEIESSVTYRAELLADGRILVDTESQESDATADTFTGRYMLVCQVCFYRYAIPVGVEVDAS